MGEISGARMGECLCCIRFGTVQTNKLCIVKVDSLTLTPCLLICSLTRSFFPTMSSRSGRVNVMPSESPGTSSNRSEQPGEKDWCQSISQ